MKVQIKMPDQINLKDAFIASEILKYNLDGYKTNCDDIAMIDESLTHVSFGMGGFIGMIPKSWLVRL